MKYCELFSGFSAEEDVSHSVYQLFEYFNISSFSLKEGSIEQIKKDRVLLIHQIYNVPHDSDEECSLYAISYAGDPTGVMHKHGDKTDWELEFMSARAANALEGYLKLFVERPDHEHKIVKFDDEYSPPKYITLHEIDSVNFYSVNDTRWASGFHRSPNPYIIRDGKVLPCKILNFMNTDRIQYAREEADNMVHIELNNDRISVDGRTLLFKLT